MNVHELLGWLNTERFNAEVLAEGYEKLVANDRLWRGHVAALDSVIRKVRYELKSQEDNLACEEKKYLTHEEVKAAIEKLIDDWCPGDHESGYNMASFLYDLSKRVHQDCADSQSVDYE